MNIDIRNNGRVGSKPFTTYTQPSSKFNTTPLPYSANESVKYDISNNVRIMGLPAVVIEHRLENPIYQFPLSNNRRIRIVGSTFRINGKQTISNSDSGMDSNNSHFSYKRTVISNNTMPYEKRKVK